MLVYKHYFAIDDFFSMKYPDYVNTIIRQNICFSRRFGDLSWGNMKNFFNSRYLRIVAICTLSLCKKQLSLLHSRNVKNLGELMKEEFGLPTQVNPIMVY
jgi:hypothetical protein